MTSSVSSHVQTTSHQGGRTIFKGNLAMSLGGLMAAESPLQGRVVILCAEPDMGKTTVLSQVLSHIEGHGGKTKFVSLNHYSANRAVSRVIAVCRQMSHYIDGSRVVGLAFDDLPDLDESDTKRIARAVRKFTLAGGNILISIAPEAETIIADLPDALVYRSDDLRLRDRRYAVRCGLDPDIYDETTRGIAGLVRVALLSPGMSGDQLFAEPRFLNALGDAVEHALRPSLIWEERWLRLAMIELGQGSVDDLRSVVGDIDQSLLEAIARDAPLFGLDAVGETFCCAGVSKRDVLRSILPRLRPLMGKSHAVSSRAVRVLIRRGDYRRASVAVLASAPLERASTILEHSIEFINVGACDLVEDAISYAARAGLTEHVGETRLALAALTEPRREYESLRAALDTASQNPSVCLLVEFRDSLANAKANRCTKSVGAQSHGGAGQADGFRRAIAEATAALRLMRDLQFEDAYEYLMSSSERLSDPTVASCLVWIEYMLSMGMSGNAPTEQDLSGFDAAAQFAAECGVPFVWQLMQAVYPLVSDLASRGDNPAAVESCAQKAALLDMPLVEEVCLLAAGVADVKADACARAFVRIQRASELAGESGDAYVEAVCHTLMCAVKRMLGERVMTDEVLSRRMPPRVSAVARALAAVIESSDTVRLEVMGRTKANACPQGTSWLVQVLATSCGKLSQRFRMVVPRPWLDEARVASIVAGEFAGEGQDSREPFPGTDQPDEAYRVDVSVLGGFHVLVNGAPVNEARMDRRRAKCLLALLAVLPEHSAKRFEAMENVWPDLDYHDARQRVYEATSVLRTELTSRLGVRGDPLVSSRGSGTLGLNPSCVHCDVDDFERLAKSLVSNPRLRPTDVVNGCARLERLYRGDVFVPLVDGAGLVAERRDELKSLYADAMVYASQQAFALNRAETAVHFAQNACTAAPLREDAELCLMRALGAAGRRLDVESSYRTFVERVTQEAKRPVSQALRDAYHDLAGGGEELVLHVGGEDERRAESA